jgi:hypothetical protein
MIKQKTAKLLIKSAVAILMFSAVISFSLTESSALATLDDADITEIAGRRLSEEELSSVKNDFAATAQELSLTNPSELSTAREIILYQDYGSATRLVYNFSESKCFLVPADYYAKYLESDNFRRLGAPMTNKGTFNISGRTVNSTLTAAEYTAQIFEKGALITDGTEIVMHVGAVESTADGYVLHPVIDDQDVMEKKRQRLQIFRLCRWRDASLKKLRILFL